MQLICASSLSDKEITLGTIVAEAAFDLIQQPLLCMELSQLLNGVQLSA
jgi:hypothetical protein